MKKTFIRNKSFLKQALINSAKSIPVSYFKSLIRAGVSLLEQHGDVTTYGPDNEQWNNQ
jgi:hypothetical protein